ncbi:MAG TPA: sulfite exporter TauE/SafE family protein [Usitatibacter sp.]|nr:sulfite exporter TauE/SafE family protein [Usitatibacter sp.]
MEYAILLAVALAAGTLGGVVGTGSSMVLMPFLVVLFGPKHAVPIMAIAAILGNLGRVIAWRRLVDWRAVAAYSATAIPGAALGVRSLLALPARAVDVALGLFFVSMILARRWFARHELHVTRLHLALVGGPIGFLTGIVVSTGPLSVPIFLAYGLEKGAFLSTEAAASLAIYCAKIVTFRASGALPVEIVAKGLLCGSAVMAGAFVGRHLVLRMSTEMFKHVLDGVMLVSGASLLWAAVR